MFDSFCLILVFARVIGVTKGPCGGITHVLGALKRLKINARYLGPSELLT
jgi:hypothetical protein